MSNRGGAWIVVCALVVVGCGSPKPAGVQTSSEAPSLSSVPTTTAAVAEIDAGAGGANDVVPVGLSGLVHPDESLKGFAVAPDGIMYFGIVDRVTQGHDCTADLYRSRVGDSERERVAHGVSPTITADGSTLAFSGPRRVERAATGTAGATAECGLDDLVLLDIRTGASTTVSGGALDQQRSAVRTTFRDFVSIEGLNWSPDGSQLTFILQNTNTSWGVLLDRATTQTVSIQSPRPVDQPTDSTRWVLIRALHWLANGELAARVVCERKGCPTDNRPDTTFGGDPGWVHVRDNAVVLPFEKVQDENALKELCAYSRPSDCESRPPATTSTTIPSTTLPATSRPPTTTVATYTNLGTADDTPPPSITSLAQPNEAILGYAIGADGTRYFSTVSAAIRGRDCTANLFRVVTGSTDRQRIATGIWPALTADGSTLAFVAPVFVEQRCNFERLITMDTKTREVRAVEGGALAERVLGAHRIDWNDGVLDSLQWSPDGTRLKFLFTTSLFAFGLVLDQATRQTIIIDYPTSASGGSFVGLALVRALRWLPDGTMAARLACQNNRCPLEEAVGAFVPDPGWFHVRNNAAIPPYDPITDRVLLDELCKFSRPSDC